MKTKAIVGILALVCSSVGSSATITVTPSTANPAPTDTLSVTISGDALFPLTTGATLGVTYDAAVISIQTAVPIATGFNFATFLSTGPGTGLISVISTAPAGVAGPFDAFTLNLTALAAGNANLVFVDDGADLGWSDPDALLIPGVVYNQASITVAVATSPDIAVDNLNVTFGDIAVGQTSPQVVTVTNNGGAALNVGQVAGLVAPFSLGTDNCSNQAIAPAVSCTIQVQFTPVAGGPFSSSLDIPSNDPDTATVAVAVSGNGVALPAPNIVVTDSVAPAGDLSIPFGSITVAGTDTQTVTVTNSGTATLEVGPVAGLVAPFSPGIDTCSNLPLAPAASCTIEVQFDPVAVGSFNSSLNIPSNDPDTATVAVSVSGTGASTMVPNIAVSDSVNPADDLLVDFGAWNVGSTSGTQTVTVTNAGAADLVITNVLAPLAPFSTTSDLCTGKTLKSAQNCKITVTFTPAALQPYNGTLSISSNDPDTATVTVNLSGSGDVSNIVVTDSVTPADDLQIPYGSVFQNAAVQQTVTVTNNGVAHLIIGTVGSSNGLATPFSIIAVADTCSGQALATSESCTIVVVFGPGAIEAYNDSFDIPSDDPDGTVTVAVSGAGKRLPTPGGSSALDPGTLVGLVLVGLAARRRRRLGA